MSTEQPVNIKQRLIGAIVLVSLAVIFLPMILKDHSQYPGQEKLNSHTADIPPVPSQLQVVQEQVKKSQTKPLPPKQPALPKPRSIPLDSKNKAAVNRTVKTESVKKKMVQATPKPIKKAESKSKKEPSKLVAGKKSNAKKVDQSYAIQLGSFGSQKNAVELKRKLQRSKYRAYIEVIKTSKGIRHRVRVGPYLKRDQIAAIQKKINRSFKINGKIVNYR